MKTMKMGCDCTFNLISEEPLKVDFKATIDNINMECPATWDLLSSGNTKGVFQLESQLGQSISKQVEPRDIEELAAVISIMRPGCLQSSLDDGKSLTHHFIERKQGREQSVYLHTALKPILKNTYAILVYQEQAMKIATDIAGFNLMEADTLRKAIGKKKAKMMAEIKGQFLEGCAQVGIIDSSQAEELFGWIQASQRYSFNKSHAVSYAYNAYISAYLKTHFPTTFFATYLSNADSKPKPFEEIRQLVNNAKNSDIFILNPDIREKNPLFKVKSKSKIVYGLRTIKGIGDSILKTLFEVISEVDLNNISWFFFLVHIAPKVNSTAVKALIGSGALDHLNISRTKMLYEYNIYSKLTGKNEPVYMQQLDSDSISLEMALEQLIAEPYGRGKYISSVKRHNKVKELLNSLRNPPYELVDSNDWIVGIEEELLGTSLSSSRVNSCDTSSANCTCHEFLNTKRKNGIIPVQIDKIKEITIKRGAHKGKKAAFLEVSDSTASLQSVTCWSEVWEEHRNEIIQGNTVMISGIRDKKTENFVVNKIWQI